MPDKMVLFMKSASSTIPKLALRPSPWLTHTRHGYLDCRKLRILKRALLCLHSMPEFAFGVEVPASFAVVMAPFFQGGLYRQWTGARVSLTFRGSMVAPVAPAADVTFPSVPILQVDLHLHAAPPITCMKSGNRPAWVMKITLNNVDEQHL